MDNANSSNSISIKTPAKKQTTPASPSGSIDGWTAYSSKDGQFSLEYPSNWATATYPELCPTGTLLLGANSSAVGRCGSDSGSHMYISSSKGDTRATTELRSANYPDVKTETLTVNGVTGKKQTGTYKRTSEGLGPSDGDQIVAYTFYTGGRTYSAVYNIQLEGKVMPDVLNDFNLMVTKTLKFSAQ